ncbi:hypothetical protein AB0F88_17010 [Streptosporangium sp. NPDC023963]|uniref:hypothetical protein n=1 Tax=Streptosporangium sp. NPDC023963 TaxID=3155608 RepID=UPI00343E6911
MAEINRPKFAVKKIEELVEGDEVVLWSGPSSGEVAVLVKEIHIYEDLGLVGIVAEEFEWGQVTAPIGTLVVMGMGW